MLILPKGSTLQVAASAAHSSVAQGSGTSTVFKVSIDGGQREELVAGSLAFVEHGFLHIQNDSGENVALFATFDFVTIQPATKEE